jgi:hypothetical protein
MLSSHEGHEEHEATREPRARDVRGAAHKYSADMRMSGKRFAWSDVDIDRSATLIPAVADLVLRPACVFP